MTFTKPEPLPKRIQDEIRTLERAARKIMRSKESAARFLDSIRAQGPVRATAARARR
jgi:hypothetical protein